MIFWDEVSGFRWIEWNIDKVLSHGVTPAEAEWVVARAKPPYPQGAGEEKFLVKGSTSAGRMIQVIFVTEEDDSIFVIHARPLTDREKWQESRRKRRRGNR